MARNSANEKEYRSSAWALLIVGGVGLTIVVLGITGVLPLKLGNPYLFYGVTMAVFILFLVMGVLSMKNARIFAQRARVENTLLETVETWCLENLNAEEIDCALEAGAQDEDEASENAAQLRYFRRVEYLRERINRQFLNLDQGLVEQFIDEQLYDRIFGEKS